jgi:hypothetical protein
LSVVCHPFTFHILIFSSENPQSKSIIYRGPSIDASYQVSVHLAMRIQRRRFLKIGQSETRIAYGGHVCIKTWDKGKVYQAIFQFCSEFTNKICLIQVAYLNLYNVTLTT